MRTLIIAGGTVNDAMVCETIKNGGYDAIIAADSGMEVLYRHHLTPDIVVGDFDSAAPEVLSYFQSQEQIEFCTLNKEKDDTDMEFAIREAIDREATDITIMGATGGRLDHVLSSIGLLELGIQWNVEMEIVDAKNRIRMIAKPVTLSKKGQYGDFVSLIPFAGEVSGVTLEGFKYPLTDATLSVCGSLGISNEIVEDEAKINLESGRLLVIESRD